MPICPSCYILGGLAPTEVNPNRKDPEPNRMTATIDKLEKLLNQQSANKNIFNIILGIWAEDGTLVWSGAAGVADPASQRLMRPETPYFIASITKMFTAAAIMRLHEQNLVDLETPLSRFFSAEQLAGLHRFNGQDYSAALKIYHLVGQTSGLADYFEQKNRAGQTLLDIILAEGDSAWELAEILEMVKTNLSPQFPPASTPGGGHKAFYSDTNYQLLGAILEKCLDRSLGQIFHDFFFGPLELTETYLFGDDVAGVERAPPATIYFAARPLAMPRAMRSFWADGGMVSTVTDQLTFLRALFGGQLFREASTLARMQQWNKLFFPLQYGYGLMRYKLPWFFSPFSPMPEFIGHSGASGSFSFYCPERDFYVVGTVNQLQSRSLPFKLMPRLANILK